MDDLHQAWVAQRRRRIALGSVAVACGVALASIVVLVWVCAGPVRDRWTGAVDLYGNPTWLPARDPEPIEVDGVDLRDVHGSLLPAWFIARTRGPATDERAALRDALGGAPVLVGIVDQLEADIAAGPVDRVESIRGAVDRWNVFLDEHDAPLFIREAVWASRGGWVYTKNYEVVADLQVGLGPRTHRARVLARIDRTNVVEGYLGSVSDAEEGALVMLDRVRDFVLDDVWPLLDEASDPHLDPVARAFAPTVRRTVADVLGDRVGPLAATARSRQKLVAVVADVRARRSCGSDFRIRGHLPWYGLEPDDIDNVWRAVASTGRDGCPGVTAEEAQVLSDAFYAAVGTPELRRALEALLALAVEGVTRHEIRHVGDAAAALGCDGCEALDDPARRELSAYLASLVDPRTASLAWFQACGLDLREAGSHGEAIAVIAGAVGDCGDGPSDQLSARARALARQYFGRSSVPGSPDWIRLPDDFPSALAVDE